MRGHIRLGSDINDLRDYLLVNDAKIRQRILANPMAAKLGQGAGKYDDLTNWSGWVMENWQAGLGKREADAEGFLYAELETRFQGQLTLPLYSSFEWTSFSGGGYSLVGNAPTAINDAITVGVTGTYRKIAMKFTQPDATHTGAVMASILLTGTTGTHYTQFKIYSDTGGDPDAGTLKKTATGIGYTSGLTSNYVTLYIVTTLAAGDYWLVVDTISESDTLPVYDNGGATAATRRTYDGATWTNSKYSFFYHITFTTSPPLANVNAGARKAIIYNSEPHFITAVTVWGCENAIYKYSSSTVSRVTTLSSIPKDAIAFGSVMMIAYESFRGIDSWDGASITNQAGVFANIFAAWNGYLWRAYQNDVYYTADGTTWTGPIQIGPDGYTVTGMAGLGEDMYAATDEGLYKIGAGDLVSGIMRWNSISTVNGKGMINHQGALYIPTYTDLLRFGGAEIMSVNPMKDEGLPQYKQGRVQALVSHNYWLFAVISPVSYSLQAVNSWPILIAYNDQGWHYIGKYIQTDGARTTSNLCWDVANNYLWATGEFLVYKYNLPTDHQNPYKDNSGSVKYFPIGTLETPWFYSGLKEIYKDCESVYITGENITSARPVKVYWKDDGSTDWEYLGTVTSNRQELRWSDPDTRPNTRQIKLGIVMTTDDYTQTPRVDAVRLKFQNMVTDRWRWQLSINVGDNQEMLDSDLNIYTKEQQRAHLDTLIRSVGPILFEDVDGVQYEVKVLGASEQVERYEYLENAPNFTSVYSLTVEQATTTSYN